MVKSRYLLACWICFSVLSAAARGQASIEFIGEAYSSDNMTLLYVEHHQVQLDTDRNYQSGTVVYRYPDGSVFAEKTLNFASNALVPDLRFVDQRSNKQTVVRVKEDKATIESIENDFLNSQTQLSLPGLSVADAGFDRLVLKFWDELVKGESIDFDVLALGREEFIGFEMEKVAMQDDVLTLKLASQSWLIRLLMDPIFLKYRVSSKQLIEFRGLTNILAERNGKLLDENYIANIRYQYLPSQQ